MQTASSSTLPAENFGVFRLRRQIINPFSYAGGLFTTRLGADGSYNIAFGLDATIRPVGDEFITLRVASTVDDSVASNTNTNNLLEASLFRLQWERRTNNGLSYRYTTKRYGPTFNPELGFITREDIWANGGRLGYGWFGTEDDWYRTISAAISGSSITRNEDGSAESARAGMEAELETKNGASFEVEVDYSFEDLDEDIEFPEDTVVPEGSYRFVGVEISRGNPSGSLFGIDSQAFVGSFYDGWRADIGLGPEWAASKYLQLSAEYELNMVRFPDRDQEFNAHVVRFRSQMALNTQISLSAFVQFSSASDLVTTNLRFRYNFKEGNDLWLVYNEGTNLDRDRDFNLDRNRPIAPRISNRLLLLKYTYTFGS